MDEADTRLRGQLSQLCYSILYPVIVNQEIGAIIRCVTTIIIVMMIIIMMMMIMVIYFDRLWSPRYFGIFSKYAKFLF